jgi:hypothetical protein
LKEVLTFDIKLFLWLKPISTNQILWILDAKRMTKEQQTRNSSFIQEYLKYKNWIKPIEGFKKTSMQPLMSDTGSAKLRNT